MLDPQTILLTSANWSLSGRKRGLRFDPRPQRSHAVDDGLEGDSHLGHLVYRLPELVGVDRLVERARADLLRGRIVGQEFDPHVAGGQCGCVDDEVVHPLLRVSLFRNGWDDDGLFWFDGHGKIWVGLSDVPSGAVAVYWDFGRTAISHRVSKDWSKGVVHESTSTNPSRCCGRKRCDSHRWHLDPSR